MHVLIGIGVALLLICIPLIVYGLFIASVGFFFAIGASIAVDLFDLFPQ